MSLTARLLMYLNPDEAYIGDIAQYLYGQESPYNRRRAASVMAGAVRLGWQVYRRRHDYILSHEHYYIVGSKKGQELLASWPPTVQLRPENLSMAILAVREDA